MWILPKQLHTLAFALDTEALILDLNEQSWACERSLLARSKPTCARTWSQKWKRDCWTRHLSGRMLKPFLGPVFAERWASCLEDTPANPSAQQEGGKEKMTLATSGLGLQMELEQCDQSFASLKMLRDTSHLDSETCCETWGQQVIEQRGDYSARLKLARRTRGNEYSSWPTATTRDWKDTGNLSNSTVRKDGKLRMDTLGRVVQANHSTHGNHPASQQGLCNQVVPQPSATNASGKLNPRWVETLMGLPVGWTMPSCASPVTIAPTNCDSSAMGSCPPPQSGLF